MFRFLKINKIKNKLKRLKKKNVFLTFFFRLFYGYTHRVFLIYIFKYNSTKHIIFIHLFTFRMSQPFLFLLPGLRTPLNYE